MFGLRTPDKADLAQASVDPQPADTQTIAADDEAGDETNSASEPGDSSMAEDAEEGAAQAEGSGPLETAGDSSEAIVTPEVKAVTVTHNGAITAIEAEIFTAEGWVKKRIVLPLRLMAHEIATHIANVESW